MGLVTGQLSESKHEKLKALAKDRQITLGQLSKALLEWGADQDVPTLYRLGVRIPLYPSEHTQSDSTS